MPDLKHVSPRRRRKRIFSWRTVIDLVKMIVKAAIIGVVMWFTIKWILPLIVGSLYQPLPELSKLFWSLLMKLFAVAVAVSHRDRRDRRQAATRAVSAAS